MKTTLLTALLATLLTALIGCGDETQTSAIPHNGQLVCAYDEDGYYRATRLVCDQKVKIDGAACYVRLYGERVPYSVGLDSTDREYFSAQDPIECVVANLDL